MALAADSSAKPSLSDVDAAALARLVTPEEFAGLKQSIDPRLLSGEVKSEEFATSLVLMWECISQSATTGLWYYWDSYNAQYARYMALNACVYANGYTCGVDCRVI